ncbi:hypothetical protein SUGI_1011250 [Cryptomeria japonica]|uniref:probable F-box protein At4g22030 n=1 Tax=Cryptomeria japonica TaxID=3369 RepID=UPI002414964F|nr:probable F-box protein At4g22030 [Cryptomeria japonica]GLJ47890.1 hypothetical protein SUGI_1011250 [Cryptomeria japonica]
MEALKLTRALKSNTALQTVTQKHGHVRLANYANNSWRINLDRRDSGPAMIVASLDGPSTSTRYLQQKQVDLFIRPLTQFHMDQNPNKDEEMVVAKLRLVAAAAADRAEMHGVLAEQRDGWNKLLLASLTNITLAALILQALPNNDSNNVVATLLYGFSTALMCGVNKIQPSQLAEEQRMAARLFRQLNTDIHTNLALPPHLRQDKCAESFLAKAYKAVLALDEAYPLPLFPGMLDKFPKIVRPTVWWPQHEQYHQTQNRRPHTDNNTTINGWSAEVEEELRGISETLKTGDIAEYVGLSRKVLGANSILAIAGPLLTGIAGALNLNGAMLSMSMVAGVLGVVGNTLSHAGQVGMVFEMYRNCAGFYHLLDSSISDTLSEADPEERENGELFHWRLALQLGRDPHSPLADSASKFAGKLF